MGEPVPPSLSGGDEGFPSFGGFLSNTRAHTLWEENRDEPPRPFVLSAGGARNRNLTTSNRHGGDQRRFESIHNVYPQPHFEIEKPRDLKKKVAAIHYPDEAKRDTTYDKYDRPEEFANEFSSRMFFGDHSMPAEAKAAEALWVANNEAHRRKIGT